MDLDISRSRSRHSTKSLLLRGLVLTMFAGVLSAIAVPEPVWRPDALEPGDVAQGSDGEVSPRPHNPVSDAIHEPSEVTWPAPATTSVAVSAIGARVDPALVGQLPVAVSATSVHSPETVQFTVVDHDQAAAAGLLGVPFELDTSSHDNGNVEIEIDYSGFENGYGGDFGARLRLYRLSNCGADTLTQCGSRVLEAATNDTGDRTLNATVPPQGMYLLAAAADSSQGDYAATNLAPSAEWNVSGSSGEFTWSYPLELTSTPGGLAPAVGFSYGSQSVDGRTAATNNQGSWLGEGFSYEPGYIERRYKPCHEDGHEGKGDLCWAWDNATIMLNGVSGELVKDGDTWRISSDDGSRVERLTGATNGDNDGEYWVVTTTDGTSYYFGLHRLPGWSSGDETTDSTWLVPVFGNDSGEPCHDSSFDQSYCDQAWRWNLDHVVDTRGNAMSYHYAKETNYYSRNADVSADGDAYTRGGYLKRIDYGQRDGEIYSSQAPAQVVFGTSERCLPTSGITCAADELTDGNAHYWPDVPFDLLCKANTKCSTQISPTFFTRKKVSTITSQVRVNGSYTKVDSWALEHLFTDNADGSKTLWLNTITRTGHAGGDDVTMPPVELQGIQLANRVDTIDDDISPLIRFRLARILTEFGGQIDVDYSAEDCAPGDTPTPRSNTRRCFPVNWAPLGQQDPITDWFHKYVVDQVVMTDRTGGAPDQVTRYTYEGGAAWRHTEADGITDEEYQTWSVWRGYRAVSVSVGDPGTITPEKVKYTYFRGMHGDDNGTGGTRDVSVTDSEGGTHTDHDQLAGTVLEATTLDGTNIVSKTISTQWRQRTALRSHDWGDQQAYYVRPATSRAYTAVDVGWRVTETRKTYDTTLGRLTKTNDLGDIAVDTDDRCTRTDYADNPGAHLYSLPWQVQTVATACDSGFDPATDIISSNRTGYDGAEPGDMPSTGLATTAQVIIEHDGTDPTYLETAVTEHDMFGRPTSVTNAAGHTTTTQYLDTDGLNTTVIETNPLGHTKTIEYEPWRHQSTLTTDPNGNQTRYVYDGLGHLTEVYLPHMQGSTPTFAYTYNIAPDQIISIKTVAIAVPQGTIGFRTSYELFDGWLRPRQTQVQAAESGRIVSDTLYNSAGRIEQANDFYYNDQAVAGELFLVVDGDTEGQVLHQYDGAGREIATIFATAGQEQWRTTMSHEGDRTHVTPPRGGTATTTIVDARGNTTAARQYHGAEPVGAYDETTYTYTPRDQLATVTDSVGNTWSYRYDLRGNRVQGIDPDTGLTLSTYDQLGQLATVTDARGRTIAFAYDELGRKTGEFENDVAGQRLAVWRYDQVAKGQLYSAGRYYDGQVYGYSIPLVDELYRPIRTIYHVPQAEGELSGAYEFTTSYNLDGSIQTMGLPAAGGLTRETIVFNYDVLGQITSVAGDSAYATNLAYAYTGELLRAQYGSGTERLYRYFEYEDGTNRLTRARIDPYDATQVIQDSWYTYDQAGNVRAIVDQPSGGARDAQCFDYDYLGRMTQAWSSAAAGTGHTEVCEGGPAETGISGAAPYWHSYTFDATGNRTSKTVHGTDGGADYTTEYTYSDPGSPQPHAVAVISNSGKNDRYLYDATGNTASIDRDGDLQVFNWDIYGKLDHVSQGDDVVSYRYDANGNRIARHDATGNTVYLPGMEIRWNDVGSISCTRYLPLPGGVELVTTPALSQYHASDHHGTGTIAVDADTGDTSHRHLDPFGASRGADVDWLGEKGFVGGTIDPTGFTHIGAREYDPDHGRFMSVDPIIDFANPQQLNGYAYANNAPVTSSDPTGLIIDDRGGAVGGDYKPPPPGMQCMFGVGLSMLDFCYTDASLSCNPATQLCIGSETFGAEGVENEVSLDWMAIAGYGKYFHQLTPQEQERVIAEVWCANNPAACEEYLAQGDAAFWDLVFDVVGITDMIDCQNGSVEGCVWTALGFIPGEKLALLYAKAGKWVSKALDAASDAAPWSKKCNSFVPGTLVLMADGTYRPIEDIQVGDFVIAADPVTGETGPQRVTATPSTPESTRDLVDITIDTDGDGGADGTVTTTAGHAFWTADSSDGDNALWQPARDLTPDTWLLSDAGVWVQISAADGITGQVATYTLTVETRHSYYVQASASSVLVHNCPNGDDFFSDFSDWSKAAETPDLSSLKKLKDNQLAKIVGNAHGFKEDILGKGTKIAQFDAYIDTSTGYIFLIRKGGGEPIPTYVKRLFKWYACRRDTSSFQYTVMP